MRGEKRRERKEGVNTGGGEETGRKKRKGLRRKRCHTRRGFSDTHFDPANQIGN